MAASVASKRPSPLEWAASRWRAWTEGAAAAPLGCCDEGELVRLARDVGLSSAELRDLARLGPGSADLLLRRMAELDLDRAEVERTQPATFHDLQRVCMLCAHHRRCLRDLSHNAADPAWERYCPNVATLKALDAQPWASRSEW
jgi:hypothetical protein